MQESNNLSIQENSDQSLSPARREWVTPDFVRIELNTARHHSNNCVKNDGFPASDC